MEKYQDRVEAGIILADQLRAYKDKPDVLVLALPRGGVPVAFQIAKTLHAPLDVFIVRKLGVPGHPELAMGAMAMNNTFVFNDTIIHDLHIPKSAIDAVIAEETQELKRREKVYRGNHPYPSLKDKTIILVDDGIATGATMRAAIKALNQLNPAAIIVAVPVADKSMCEQIELQVDRLICPMQPMQFYAVGAWYVDFAQTEDQEVFSLLEEARQYVQHTPG